MSYRGGNSAARDEAHAGGVLLSRHGKHEEAAEMFARAAEISLEENKKHSALYAINAQFGSLLRLGVVHENRDEDDAKVREVRDRFRRVAGEPDGDARRRRGSRQPGPAPRRARHPHQRGAAVPAVRADAEGSAQGGVARSVAVAGVRQGRGVGDASNRAGV